MLPSPRRRLIAGAIIVCVVALFAYSWVLWGYFLGDDFGYVHRFWSMDIRELPRLFLADWSGGIFGFPLKELRPVTAISFWTDAHLWADNPFGYHLTNLLLHVGCTGLVIAVTAALLESDSVIAPIAAGLVFALHPIHVETVAWITARADLLATAGVLCGLLGFVNFRRRGEQKWMVLAWAAFGAAIFSKEFALTLPLLALGYDAFVRPKRVSWRELALPYAGYATLAIVYYICRHQAFDAVGSPAVAAADTKTFWRGLAQREFIYLQYLFGWMQGWLPIADRERVRALRLLLRIVAITVAVLALWIWSDRRRGAIEAKVGAYAVLWLVIGTLPFIVATYLSTRHVYFASVAISLGVGAILARFRQHVVVSSAFAGVVVITCAIGLARGSEPWRIVSAQSRDVSVRVQEVARQAADGDLMILNIPGSISGAYLWAWASPFALRPPFQPVDITGRLSILEFEDVFFLPAEWQSHRPVRSLRDFSGNAWMIETAGRGAKVVPIDSTRIRAAASDDFVTNETPGLFGRFIVAVKSERP